MTGLRTLRAARPSRAWAALLVAAFVIPWLLLAAPVRACSCAGGLSLAEYARDPNTAVFTGTVGPREARGVPVAVERWYAGPGAGLVVWISPQSFGDSGMCGISEDSLPLGARMFFVGWVPEAGEDVALSICQPYAPLDAPDGADWQAEAERTFGLGGPVTSAEAPPGVPASQPPTSAPTPGASAPPSGGAGMDPTGLAIGLTAIAGAAVLGGAALLARRR